MIPGSRHPAAMGMVAPSASSGEFVLAQAIANIKAAINMQSVSAYGETKNLIRWSGFSHRKAEIIIMSINPATKKSKL